MTSTSCVIKEEDLEQDLRVLVKLEGHFHPGKIQAISPPDIYGVLVDKERGNKPHIFSREEVLREAVSLFVYICLHLCVHFCLLFCIHLLHFCFNLSTYNLFLFNLIMVSSVNILFIIDYFLFTFVHIFAYNFVYIFCIHLLYFCFNLSTYSLFLFYLILISFVDIVYF